MKGAWVLERVPEELVTPEAIYEIYYRHRMVPESMPLAIGGFRQMANGSWVGTISAGGAAAASVIISGIIDGERADLDLIPVSKFFRGGYEEELRSAMAPVWGTLFDRHGVRRVNASVPASRRRAVNALRVLGFRVEGVMRSAVKLAGRSPEDLVLLGLLKTDLEGKDGST